MWKSFKYLVSSSVTSAFTPIVPYHSHHIQLGISIRGCVLSVCIYVCVCMYYSDILCMDMACMELYEVLLQLHRLLDESCAAADVILHLLHHHIDVSDLWKQRH